MKPNFEKVLPDSESSLTFLNRRLDESIPFEWHHHPEFELTLTLNSRGHRYIGDNIEWFDDDDLILIGPHVPHGWCSSERINSGQPHIALVIWFTSAWISSVVDLFPEMQAVRSLMVTLHQQAIRFGSATQREVRPLIEAMIDRDTTGRLILLLDILQRIGRDSSAERLITIPACLTDRLPSEDLRMHRVLEYLHIHYAEPIAIPDLAEMACISISAFHRMFRRHTRRTTLDYISRLRIGRACTLLLQETLSISAIAETVGYSSLALFNRQFLAQKGMTPRAFRLAHIHHFH
ncbi:helix-turn-helix domain-containing protein [Azomonas macrocytogenes]|uniref:AraC-like DNA-binding protein n=1 Tax=Azomonas macrocytogenes TaxID=69962 RepID=A0A839T4N3_AZOMA|nr:AraC family transcriptional regulator [Azomonas macrocytogenes]MBB3104038.1 AraC-like DNA-binding protein [Azomonas macrocytogenes]